MMNNKTVVHIVPEFPPMKGGVGDYAFHLASALSTWHAALSQTIVVTGYKATQQSFESIQNVTIVYVKEAALFDYLNSNHSNTDVFICHYVPHGYDKRGIPVTFIRALTRFLKSYQGQSYGIFHELYAVSTSIVSSTFWLSHVQMYLTRKLARALSSGATTSKKYQQILNKWTSADAYAFLPVFSNVTSNKSYTPIDKINNVLVFGSAGLKQKLLDQLMNQKLPTSFVAENAFIQIGTPVDFSKALSMHSLGYLNAEEVVAELKIAKWGLLCYSNMPLEKSGVFAAYAAWGVVPIVWQGQSDVYKRGEHYICIEDIDRYSAEDIHKIAAQLVKTYTEMASIDSHIAPIIKRLNA